MLKEICSENPEATAAYNRLSDEQKAKAESAIYIIGEAMHGIIRAIQEGLKAMQEMTINMKEFSREIIKSHPYKRVVHLALYGKGRTRKKNINRIKKELRRLNNGGRKMD